MIRNKKEYDDASKELDEIFDMLDDVKTPPEDIGDLFDEAEVLSDALEEYENNHPEECSNKVEKRPNG
jgi:hypothetical protein